MITNFSGQVRVTLIFTWTITLNLQSISLKIIHIGHSRAAVILTCFLIREPKVLLKACCVPNFGILYPSLVSTSYYRLNDKLDNVKCRFTTRINGLSCLSYEDRLVYLKLDLLRVRRIKQDMVMRYKIINGWVAIQTIVIYFHSTVFEHVNIMLNCIYHIADLTYVNSAFPEEFALYETIYHTIVLMLSA